MRVREFVNPTHSTKGSSNAQAIRTTLMPGTIRVLATSCFYLEQRRRLLVRSSLGSPEFRFLGLHPLLALVVRELDLRRHEKQKKARLVLSQHLTNNMISSAPLARQCVRATSSHTIQNNKTDTTACTT